jgi:mannose-6-phosphate isomerase
VLDFKAYSAYKSAYTDKLNQAVFLAGGEYFHTHKLWLNKAHERNHLTLDSLVIYLCIEGSCKVKAGAGELLLQKGQTCLVPACIANVSLEPQGECVLLETYVPAYHA